MNLNKYHKEAIVRSVMHDIPNHGLEELEKRVKKMVDEDIKKHCPKEVYTMWTTPALAPYLSTVSRNAGYLCEASHRRYVSDLFYVTYPSAHSISAEFTERVTPLITAQLEALEERRYAVANLEAAIAGIRTRKQFVELFPELEKYAPKESVKGTLLPALANVVADLSKLGWPASKNAEAATA